MTTDDSRILASASTNSDDWDDETWAAWFRHAERVHGSSSGRARASDQIAELTASREMAISRAVQLENENARLTSTDPWQRATDGLNALVDAGVGFWIEPDGHISNPMGDEHIEYDRETERWRLVHDEEDI